MSIATQFRDKYYLSPDEAHRDALLLQLLDKEPEKKELPKEKKMELYMYERYLEAEKEKGQVRKEDMDAIVFGAKLRDVVGNYFGE